MSWDGELTEGERKYIIDELRRRKKEKKRRKLKRTKIVKLIVLNGDKNR